MMMDGGSEWICSLQMNHMGEVGMEKMPFKIISL
jgi:hypothetical protein